MNRFSGRDNNRIMQMLSDVTWAPIPDYVYNFRREFERRITFLLDRLWILSSILWARGISSTRQSFSWCPMLYSCITCDYGKWTKREIRPLQNSGKNWRYILVNIDCISRVLLVGVPTYCLGICFYRFFSPHHSPLEMSSSSNKLQRPCSHIHSCMRSIIKVVLHWKDYNILSLANVLENTSRFNPS